MTQPLTILVATHYKPLVSLLERAMQGRATVRQVDPRADTVLNSLGINDDVLVALHAGKGNDDWLTLLKALHASCPRLKTLAFGEATDVGAVARGIVHGLGGYVPLNLGTDLLEVSKAVTTAVTGTDAPVDGVYGRVKRMLPSAHDGTFLASNGKALSREQAIQQCESLGLNPGETADFLGVSIDEASKVAGKALRKPRVGMSMPLDLSLIRRLAVGTAVVGVVILIANAWRRPSMPFELAPLMGTVTLDGNPLAGCFVKLTPDRSRDTKGATGIGITDARGKFHISTMGHIGAIVGHHRVAIQPPSMPPHSQSGKERFRGIPEVYVNTSTSGLTAEVKPHTTNAVSLSLLTPTLPSPATRSR